MTKNICCRYMYILCISRVSIYRMRASVVVHSKHRTIHSHGNRGPSTIDRNTVSNTTVYTVISSRGSFDLYTAAGLVG